MRGRGALPRLARLGLVLLLVAARARGEVWQPAPLFGGDVRSLAFDPRYPDRAFAGTSGGHLYRSDDAGESWRNAGVEVPFPGWVVAALTFDPNRPQRLWAGLFGIWGGGAVASSDDDGATWRLPRLESGDEDQVYALALVPGVADRIYAGTRRGVFRSDDAGGSWRRLGEREPGLVHVSSLHVDARQAETILAGTWRRVYRSDDGGTTWRGVFDGMVLDTEVFSLHPAPDRPGEIWASTCGWVYRGDALGERWSRFKSGLDERRTPSFAVLGSERLVAGTVAGAYLSTDRGASFRRTTPANLAVLSIAARPGAPGRVLLGSEGAGVWVSSDGGESFVSRPLAMRNVRVPALARMGDQIFAAVAHAGPASGVYRSPDGGTSFEPTPAELPTVLALATAGPTVYAATEAGLFARRGGAWERVAELGTARVEQLAEEGGRLYARTRAEIFERRGGRFERVARDTRFLAARVPAVAEAERLAADTGRRPLATGDGRFSFVLVGERSAFLWDSELRQQRPLAPPFAASEIRSALVVGEKLLIGSSGYGLWETRLPE